MSLKLLLPHNEELVTSVEMMAAWLNERFGLYLTKMVMTEYNISYTQSTMRQSLDVTTYR